MRNITNGKAPRLINNGPKCLVLHPLGLGKKTLGLIKADNLDISQKCNVEKGYISVSAGDIKRLREEKSTQAYE